MAEKIKIGFIGAGNMASAIARGLSARAGKFKMSAYDPDKKALEKIKKGFGVKSSVSAAHLFEISDILIIAVKPRQIEEALLGLKKREEKSCLIISIAAGVTIARLEKILGKNECIARVMPNTPALVGEGACGCAFSKNTGAGNRKLTEMILKSFCRTVIFMDEKKINAVTALSGSGPAYFFYFAEALIEGAVEAGLNEKTAQILIAQTMRGAGALMQESKEKPAVLRERVTSKGGTTERAISVMKKERLKNILKRGVMAAKKRADEMGG